MSRIKINCHQLSKLLNRLLDKHFLTVQQLVTTNTDLMNQKLKTLIRGLWLTGRNGPQFTVPHGGDQLKNLQTRRRSLLNETESPWTI